MSRIIYIISKRNLHLNFTAYVGITKRIYLPVVILHTLLVLEHISNRFIKQGTQTDLSNKVLKQIYILRNITCASTIYLYLLLLGNWQPTVGWIHNTDIIVLLVLPDFSFSTTILYWSNNQITLYELRRKH